MASPFDSAGANHEGSDYAPLTTDEYFTGLVTNRNPLRDASVPYLQRKFYQAGRFDSLWDGANMELSAKLTLIKRPGLTVYNSQTFPAIGRYYDFRTNVDSADRIRVMVDTPAAVFDGTGPAGKTLIWQKSAGAGKTSFQSVGNILYMGNGVDQIKWIQSTRSYKALTEYAAGEFINDPNGNIQVAFGFVQANVIASNLRSGAHPIGFPPVRNRLDLTLDGPSPFVNGELVTLAGLGLAAAANGLTLAVNNILPDTIELILPFVPPGWTAGPDTGIVFTGDTNSALIGVTGGAAPAWATARGASTFDGTVVWVNKGSAVQKWGTAAPTSAPIVNQAPAISPYPPWAASTYYSPNLITYNAVDLTTFVQLTVDGVTGGSEPVFNPSPGHINVDGTASWTTFNSVWSPTTAFGAQQIIVVSVFGVLIAFQNVLQGISGATAPIWNGPFGAQINDGTTVWQNIGPVVEWATIGAAVAVTIVQLILDSGGFIQQVEIAGVSGAAPPTWDETLTSITVDAGVTWINIGPFAPASTGLVGFAYSFESSVSITESNLSPRIFVMPRAGHRASLQGPGSEDPQIDTINIYATVQGGSTFIFAGSVPAPLAGPGGIWTFTYTLSDDQLSDNFEIQGAINQLNNPPPIGLIALCYHMGRLWGSVNNLQYFCTGPDATVGDGNEAWSPSNVFALPDSIARSVPFDLPNGVLLVFTAGSPFAVWGTGTANSPFYDKPFGQGSGLLSFDAMEVQGSWISMFTTDLRLLSFQPNANYTQAGEASDDFGAPIGDQFVKVTTGGISLKLYSPAGTFVTWHSAGTDDTGLIVADGSEGWFRMSPITAPESGFLWSPRAAIAGGTSAVQSVETTPGIKTLLVGGQPQATVSIVSVTLVGGLVNIRFTGTQVFGGDNLDLAGLSTFSYLNGLTLTVGFAAAGQVIGTVNHAAFPDVALTADTGTLILGSPILKRDPTVNSDNGANYGDTYATIGTIQLCQPTEVAEVAEIILDSMKVGTAPTVGLLLDEINPTVEKEFTMLERTGQDPPLLPPSVTTFNDRFSTMQNGKPTECRHMQLKIQLSVEDEPNQILTHTIYGRRKAERKQPAQ